VNYRPNSGTKLLIESFVNFVLTLLMVQEMKARLIFSNYHMFLLK